METQEMHSYIGAGAGAPTTPHIEYCENCKSKLKDGFAYFYRWCSKTCYIKYREAPRKEWGGEEEESLKQK